MNSQFSLTRRARSNRLTRQCSCSMHVWFMREKSYRFATSKKQGQGDAILLESDQKQPDAVGWGSTPIEQSVERGLLTHRPSPTVPSIEYPSRHRNVHARQENQVDSDASGPYIQKEAMGTVHRQQETQTEKRPVFNAHNTTDDKASDAVEIGEEITVRWTAKFSSTHEQSLGPILLADGVLVIQNIRQHLMAPSDRIICQ